MTRSRGAFTLVEIMVGLAVGTLLLYAVQDLLFKGSSLLEKSHSHVESAAGAQLLVEQIHADVRRLAPGSGAISASAGPPITLTVMKPDGSGQETVEYGTSPGPADGTIIVTRNGRKLQAVVLKSLKIEPKPFMVQGAVPAFGFLTSLVATDSSGSTEYPMVDFTAVDIETLKGLDPYWVPNP